MPFTPRAARDYPNFGAVVIVVVVFVVDVRRSDDDDREQLVIAQLFAICKQQSVRARTPAFETE